MGWALLLTAESLTLEAELAHLTSANSRMNSCRVRAEKLFISILRSISVLRGNLLNSYTYLLETNWWNDLFVQGYLQFSQHGEIMIGTLNDEVNEHG